MDTIVHIQGTADGLEELKEQLTKGGIKGLRVMNLSSEAPPGAVADITLGIAGDSAAITVAVMMFLATHRNSWRLKTGDGTDFFDYKCVKVEGALIGSHPVLEKVEPERSATNFWE